jgi:hypothetical protein
MCIVAHRYGKLYPIPLHLYPYPNIWYELPILPLYINLKIPFFSFVSQFFSKSFRFTLERTRVKYLHKQTKKQLMSFHVCLLYRKTHSNRFRIWLKSKNSYFRCFGSAPTIIIDCSSDLVTGKCIAMIPISDLVYWKTDKMITIHNMHQKILKIYVSDLLSGLPESNIENLTFCRISISILINLLV